MFIEKMKITVYGVGSNFIRNYQWINENYEIVGLIDGAKEKQGKDINGLQVRSIDDLALFDYEKIMVTPNAHAEITGLLLDRGVSKERIIYYSELQKPDDAGKNLDIAFMLIGGMGDGLLALNYVAYFTDRFGNANTRFSLVLQGKRGDSIRTIVENSTIREAVTCIDKEEYVKHKYQLAIRLQRYPEIIHADTDKISRLAPELIDYYFMCEKFKIFNPRYFSPDYVADGQSAFLEGLSGKKRINQPDIYNFLDIGEEFKLEISADKSALHKYGIEEGKYITVHRGCEQKNFSDKATKLWNPENYKKLIEQIQNRYSDLPIVIVGTDKESISDLGGQIIDLTGKTTLMDMASLVKYSILHIDNEGGVVHLRHALKGGESVVLFGPTSPDFFGYSENINLRSKACVYPCEWVSDDWNQNCIIDEGVALCMKELSVDMVMASVRSALG